MRRNDLSEAVRRRLVRYQPPYTNHYGVIPAPPPEYGIKLGKLATVHSNALTAIGEVDALVGRIGDPYVVNRLLLRQEAVGSSAIEGTNSTLDELLRVEESEDESGTEAARLVREYASVLERYIPEVRQRGSDLFTGRLICDIHSMLMRGDTGYRDVPGRLRDSVVWIGGTGDISTSTWNPPPPDRVERSLEECLAYMRGEGMQALTQSIVARMAVAHAHFEAVHPFRDGNGRVGRLLLPLMMAAGGHTPIYLSPYIESNREAYYSALKAAQQRDEWGEMVGMLSRAIVGTVHELNVTRAAMDRLRSSWEGRRKFRRNSASLRALDLLTEYPVLTVKRLASLLDLSFPQASAAIEQLVDTDILRERTGYSRNRIFAAEEIMKILNRPFGTEPSFGADLDGDEDDYAARGPGGP